MLYGDSFFTTMELCDECGQPTNNEFCSCAGAEAEERSQGVSPVHNTIGLISCNCCDKCREKCFESWFEENVE